MDQEQNYKRTDNVFPSDPEIDKLSRGVMEKQLDNSTRSFNPSENFVAYGNLILFLVIGVLVILGLSGFGWAGYAFVFLLYTIFTNSLIQKKILLSKYSRFPSVGITIVKGGRAVFLSILLILALTIILLLIHVNIMELILVPGAIFKYRTNSTNLFIGLPIGIIIGLLQNKFSSYWEVISLQKYSSITTGN